MRLTNACSRHRFAVWYRRENWLCNALRIEAHFGKVAARLTLVVGRFAKKQVCFFMLIQPIETQRLFIRQFEIQDWQSVNTYSTNAAVMRYMEEGQLSEAQSKQFIEENSGIKPKAFPVILKTENKLIGHMVFHPYVHQTYEIGWVLHPIYQGHGYATEAAQALLRYSFVNLQLHRVIATCQPENPASYNVMEKIGMKREGHFRKCIYREENVWWDEYFYAILDEEWFALNGQSTNHF